MNLADRILAELVAGPVDTAELRQRIAVDHSDFLAALHDLAAAGRIATDADAELENVHVRRVAA